MLMYVIRLQHILTKNTFSKKKKHTSLSVSLPATNDVNMYTRGPTRNTSPIPISDKLNC